jgi:hypothetical protein
MKNTFDGSEEDFETFNAVTRCPKCRATVAYLPAQMVLRDTLLKALSDHALKVNGISRHEHSLGFIDFMKNNKTVYCADLECKACGERFLDLVHVREVQPTRYVFISYGAIKT